MKGMAQTMFPAMGTLNVISTDSIAKIRILDEAKEYVFGLDKALSVFFDDSEVSRFNTQSGSWFTLSDDVYDILSESIRMSKLTDGAFDITSGPLNAVWKKAIRSSKLPGFKEIRQAKRLVDWHNVELDAENKRARLKKRGMSIDFGGIAKGYAADRLFEMMACEGIDNATINLGGSVGVLGKASQVGIQNPYRPTGEPLGFITLENRFAITSGTYERGLSINGKRFHHIIDSRSGEPAQNGLISVTLIGEKATELDAFATAVFVMGAEKALPLLQERGIDAVIITDSGEIYLSRGMESNFELIKKRSLRK